MSQLKIPQPTPIHPESLLGAFLRFLRRPLYTVKVPIQQGAIADILRLYSLEVVVMLPLVIIQLLVKTQLSSLGAIETGAEAISLNSFFWYAVIMAPVLEETMFRLFLRYSPVNLAVTICCWSLFVVLATIQQVFQGAISHILALIVLGSVFLRFWLKKKIDPKIANRLYQQWFPVLFYSSVLLFGLAHISNYNFTTVIGQNWTLAPLLVLTQIEGGIFLGFIRLRYGFWWAIVAHSFHNAIVLTLVVLTQLSSFDLLVKMKLRTLTSREDVILLVLLFFVLDGLILCLSTVWGMVQEWRAEAYQDR